MKITNPKSGYKNVSCMQVSALFKISIALWLFVAHTHLSLAQHTRKLVFGYDSKGNMISRSLLVLDANGNEVEQYSEEVALANGKILTISSMPNPATDEVQVRIIENYDASNQHYLYIANSNGIRVYETYMTTPDKRINVSQWASGKYTLNLIINNKEKISWGLIKL